MRLARGLTDTGSLPEGDWAGMRVNGPEVWLGLTQLPASAVPDFQMTLAVARTESDPKREAGPRDSRDWPGIRMGGPEVD